MSKHHKKLVKNVDIVSGKLTIDHIVPLAQGGSDSLVNKNLCCRKCNDVKGDMTVDQWLEYLGWE